jgi:hypothetical protein
MASDKPKNPTPLSVLNEATTNIGERLLLIENHITRIAVSGSINCSGPDLEVMLSCVRYVAAVQASRRALNQAIK